MLEEKEKEKIVQICANDNLDLGCALIKKAVREKAIEDSNNDTVI
jgi:CCR4-NOT transcription complex subunit 1